MTSNNNDLILILYGGNNAEAEISRLTSEAVFLSLKRMGYNAKKLFFDDNFLNNISKLKPKILFNALHGKFGEDGRIQSILDFLKIPYTHSGCTSSTIAMDKKLASDICVNSIKNLHSPKTTIIYQEDLLDAEKIIKNFQKPFIMKPVNEGSSAGVEVIKTNDDIDIKKYNWQFGSRMLIQEFIEGRELQIAIIDNKAIDICEIILDAEFFDYDSKYVNNKTKYLIPAPLSKEKYQEILDVSLQCHKTLNCRGVNRVELILGKDGKIYFLEMNTQPGMTATSLIPKIAKNSNISFDKIIRYLVETAKFDD